MSAQVLASVATLVLARTVDDAREAAEELDLAEWFMPTREEHMLGRIITHVVYVAGWRQSAMLRPEHLQGLPARMAYATVRELEYELDADRRRRERETVGALAALGLQAGLRNGERWLGTAEGRALQAALGPAAQRAMTPDPSPFGPSPEELVELVTTREAARETRVRSSWWRRAWRWFTAVRS